MIKYFRHPERLVFFVGRALSAIAAHQLTIDRRAMPDLRNLYM